MVKIRILTLRYTGLKCRNSDLSFVFVYSKFGLLRAKLESLRANLFSVFSGGGGLTTKKTKDILRFSRRHDLFCSFLFSV